MSARELIKVVELDLDYCNRTFGIGACAATLSGTTVRKCYNTWNTCKYKQAYDKGSLTYKFITASSSIPVGQNYLPILKSVDERSGIVNIAGMDEKLNAFGARAVVSASFIDMPFNDRLTDKYQAERISGAAQTDEPGYNPLDRLSFWTKLKARNPNYAGRAMRIKQGYIENGVLTITETRHFIISEIDGPDDKGNVTVKGKDILKLADDDRAVAPKTSTGYLSAEIDETATSVTLFPAGVGDAEYAESGWATIGTEIVRFTRSGDVFTIARGARKTSPSTHSVNDAFQQTYSVRNKRIDIAIRELLVDYAGIPASYIDDAEWEDEALRWCPQLKLTADICKPTGVNKLISEIIVLGVTVWWDDTSQKIRFKVNRPIDDEPVVSITDRDNIISIRQIDDDESRLTRVSFWTVQIDPTKDIGKDNFLQNRLIIDADAEVSMNYDDVRSREIYCRWLNDGEEGVVPIVGRRIVNRFSKAPRKYEVVLDNKDAGVSLVDVVSLTSRVASNEAGKPETQLMQVIERQETTSGHQFKIIGRRFQFDKKYAYITENSRPDYGSSSDAQKARGAYFSDGENLFSDGGQLYCFS